MTTDSSDTQNGSVSKKLNKDKSASKKKKKDKKPKEETNGTEMVEKKQKKEKKPKEETNGAEKAEKKKKKDKKSKEVVEEVANGDDSQKKKKKRKIEEVAAAEPIDGEKLKKKNKNKSKQEETSAEPIKPAKSVEASNKAGTIQKVFYKEHAEVVAMSKADVDNFRQQHTMAVTGTNSNIKPIQSFQHLGLPSDMMACCSEFKQPTPIQSQCWPIILSGRDIIGIAETGSGKTLGFTLPALMHIRAQKPLGKKPAEQGPIMLVLSPTRELAMQTQDVCLAAGKACGVRSTCIYGGMSKRDQIQALQGGVHIVVATPGRLLGLHRDGLISLARVTYLVLDEADRMLDQGFEPDIRAIIAQVQPKPLRQTVMFSATWPLAIQALGKEFLHDPVHVTIGTPNELAANHRVKQTVEVIEDPHRFDRLCQLLKEYHSSRTNRVLIFVLYKKEVDRIEQMLNRKGWKAKGISGDKSQPDRIAALAAFKDGSCPLLIATDVAARGLDIPNVEHVINYSFPLTIEDYVHRIGRTGRGGKTGNSYTFFQRFDKGMSGELINVLNEAGETVPPELLKFGSGVKKKAHALYGVHFKPQDENKPMKEKVHMKF